MPARQQYKQASAITDDEDGLANNVGAKLLIQESQKDELRKRGPRSDIAQNYEINGALDAEADAERNFADEMSSDDGLIAPKKVSFFSSSEQKEKILS